MAGVITLLGNATIEGIKAANNLALEQEKAKAALVTTAMSTGDPAAARRNLLFFLDAGMIPDPQRIIRPAVEAYSPVLPSVSGERPASPTPMQDYDTQFWAASILPDRIDDVDRIVDRIVQRRREFESIGQSLNTTWYIVGVLWSQNRNYIQTYARRYRQPERTWIVDYLTTNGLTNLDRSSVGDCFERLELWYGPGNSDRTMYSAVLWGATHLYTSGDFQNGRWNPDRVSDQVGAAAVLRRMIDLRLIAIPRSGPMQPT